MASAFDKIGKALGIDIERADKPARRFYRLTIALLIVIVIEFVAIDILLLTIALNLPD